MPLPDHVKTTFRFTHVDSLMEASFALYWTIDSGTLTHANGVAFADSVMAHFDGPVAGCLPENVRFSNVHVRSTSGGSEVEANSSDLGPVGVNTSESLPEHDAVCIRRKTGTTGRARRGRIFFPFVPEVFATETGVLTGAAVTAYSAFATLLDQPFVSAGTGITINPVQPSPSLNILLPVAFTELVTNIVTRRDRQAERRRAVVAVN